MHIKVILFLMLIYLSSCAQAEEASVNKDSALEKRLTPLQYKVTQECGTEPPFRNEYWDNTSAGIYVDIVSGEPLFSSKHKFKSGTGWPSFTQVIDGTTLIERKDESFGMTRVEVRSKVADSHLGHLFTDGPGEKGLRYCINSASLNFIPVEKMAESGYGDYLYQFYDEEIEMATFGAGCFWGVEHILKAIDGVVETAVGYAGGKSSAPSYREVSTGLTGHAEVVQLWYDPSKVSYETLLDYFWRLHDPTTKDRQGVDVGTQYRSIILYHSKEQKQIAVASKAAFDKKNSFGKSAVTQIEPYTVFYPGENYHQDYYAKKGIDLGGGPICHTLRESK